MNPPADAKVQAQPAGETSTQPAPNDATPPPLISRPAVLRFALALAALTLWLGYLGYLVWTSPERGRSTDRLSNPQVLASTLDVVATVTGTDEPVKVEEVLYAAAGNGEQLAGQSIEVTNLDDCQEGFAFTGPGKYLLLLEPTPDGKFRVVGIPPSPGFIPGRAVRIYPATAEVLSQYRDAPKPAQP